METNLCGIENDRLRTENWQGGKLKDRKGRIVSTIGPISITAARRFAPFENCRNVNFVTLSHEVIENMLSKDVCKKAKSLWMF